VTPTANITTRTLLVALALGTGSGIAALVVIKALGLHVDGLALVAVVGLIAGACSVALLRRGDAQHKKQVS
jgi:hypothetical protein